MANLKLIRKTLTGDSEAFAFETVGLKFLVKNFSSSDMLVNFDPITAANESSSILLPAQTAQIVLTNENNPDGARTLYVKGTGKVEVQVILW